MYVEEKDGCCSKVCCFLVIIGFLVDCGGYMKLYLLFFVFDGGEFFLFLLKLELGNFFCFLDGEGDFNLMLFLFEMFWDCGDDIGKFLIMFVFKYFLVFIFLRFFCFW